MKTVRYVIILIFTSVVSFGQSNAEVARSKAQEALSLMDSGKLDESIALLEESEKLDPENYMYPYEIAYANLLKKDYSKSIEILNKTKHYKNINNQVFQLLGNSYSYNGNPEAALASYDEGLKKFPDAGNLYLEKGNIYYIQEQYDEAIKYYKEGVEADPMFPSNYYRLALLYLSSNDKLSGLIYGEIFMNIERTTKRTTEMSKLLFDTYKEAIVFEDENNASIHFCDIVFDAAQLEEKKFKMPFCGVFGKHFILSTLGQKDVNLESLSVMRTNFITNFYKEDHKDHPNVLFAYHKKLLDDNLFDAYNRYLFQVGASSEFEFWQHAHKPEYDRFIKWYTDQKNSLIITKKNRFI